MLGKKIGFRAQTRRFYEKIAVPKNMTSGKSINSNFTHLQRCLINVACVSMEVYTNGPFVGVVCLKESGSVPEKNHNGFEVRI